jgi:KUP system potassium uptake protein
MVVWFTVLALAGVRVVADRPDVLRALSPTYGVDFILHDGGVAFVASPACSRSAARRFSSATCRG